MLILNPADLDLEGHSPGICMLSQAPQLILLCANQIWEHLL